MILRRYSPSAQLQPFIKAYLVVDANTTSINRIIPDTSMTMVFRYRGKVKHQAGDHEHELPFASISGLRKSFRLITYTPGSGNILVQFREEGASPFFHEPLHEFMNDSVALSNLSRYKDITSIESQLAELDVEKDKIDLIENYLLSKISYHKPDMLVHTALQKIHSTNGTIRINELTDLLCISKDPFEKRFRQAIGIPAKQFSSIVRLRSIIHNKLSDKTLSDAALDAGYFDQAHFSKDFKLFTGQTPTDFLTTPARW